jgi:anti-sigma factor RsiW
MHEQAHPDTELLDRLRAGLLDDNIDVRTRLEHHLDTCPRCRARLLVWEHLGPEALGAWPVADSTLSLVLRQARRHAMTAGRRRHIQHYPLLATAAMLIIALSAGLWGLRHEFMETPQMTARTTEEVPDLYEDLDFYLWMANQGDGTTHEKNGNGDSAANRT